jgi:hypothetical protein
MKSLKNEIHKLSSNPHVGSKIYREFYNIIFYIAKEGCHINIVFRIYIIKSALHTLQTSAKIIRKVWKYQRGNQQQKIEGQIIQWPKEKDKQIQITIYDNFDFCYDDVVSKKHSVSWSETLILVYYLLGNYYCYYCIYCIYLFSVYIVSLYQFQCLWGIF